ESLVSPAAAVTGETFPAGCYKIEVTQQNTCNTGNWSDGLNECVQPNACASPTEVQAGSLTAAGPLRTPAAAREKEAAGHTIGSNCTITTAWSQRPNNTCRVAGDASGLIVISNSGQSLLFKAGNPGPGDDIWHDNFRIFMTCT